ncbi:PilZ domain-containing protein [Lamprobacter modestohalophilus]|uniref:HD domain-containing phosphohydrolase n=1 Tax=Lamprobacter modestohalophilus TaxID=1064514 RepID=UPI002ADED8D7|nr:HD domain-containing phosphohydrolase [Lamprobacter modestohalophilus]MEA1050060.1 PilZ domain-containing protein [Lamprobacter modestohalophilus]
MKEPQDGYTCVQKPSEIETLLGQLSEPGGASLVMEDSDGKALPVLVAEQVFGDHLLLDISAIRELAGPLKRGQPFRLVGESKGMMLRTPVLVITVCEQQQGRLRCRCDYPLYLEVLQRRQYFRAKLRLGMEVGAILRDQEDATTSQGDLKNLSLDGCMVEMPISSANMLVASEPLEIELCFPDGTRFAIKGFAKHYSTDIERQVMSVGFQFNTPNVEEERQLWLLVREIERESARQSASGGDGLLRSLLFQTDPKAPPLVARRNAQRYATPMTKRLARVAGYLDAQLLELSCDHRLDPVQLSRHADRLLLLHDEDREAVLFAVRCLSQEATLVRHCLAVAVHLLDLATLSKMPRDACKAVAACAMVHDFGKAFLPDSVVNSPELDQEQRALLTTHVALLEPSFERCQWLASSVLKSVVFEINERLDGSGYPLGLSGDQLGELSRVAMVVDAVDAMRRERPDRPARSMAHIYARLAHQSERFDQRWLKRYISAFGSLPIGSLVRFEAGQLAWIQRLDAKGRPLQVQLTDAVKPPDDSLGEVLRDEAVLKLGKPLEEMVVSL